MYITDLKLGGIGAATFRRVCLGEILSVLVRDRAVDRLVKDRVKLVDVKLGFKLRKVVGEAATVGAATGVG
jgi:hypothetical protein